MIISNLTQTMKRTTLLLCFISSSIFAQDFTIGLAGNLGYGKLRGFLGTGELNYNKFYGKNFTLGVNASFNSKMVSNYLANQNFSNFSPIAEAFFVRENNLSTNVTSRYYLGAKQVCPFLYAEIGFTSSRQKFYFDSGEISKNPYQISNPNYGFGAGLSFWSKNKKWAVDGLFTLQRTTVTDLINPLPFSNNTLQGSYLLSRPGLRPSFKIGIQRAFGKKD